MFPPPPPAGSSIPGGPQQFADQPLPSLTFIAVLLLSLAPCWDHSIPPSPNLAQWSGGHPSKLPNNNTIWPTLRLSPFPQTLCSPKGDGPGCTDLFGGQVLHVGFVVPFDEGYASETDVDVVETLKNIPLLDKK